MRRVRLALAACAMCLLAACAEQPARQTPPPAPITVAPPPIPAPAITPPAPTPAPPPDSWSRLRASFALDDCTLDPQAETWARRFTRDPSRFQAQLKDALPLLLYVQDAAERAGVPGEFVLLPMIESRYEPGEPGRHGDPAGMWQIMPQTAHAFGLTVNRSYDGRLDPIASTQAVMKMLLAFHDDLHDWRLVDMAFNTGEYRMLDLLDGRDPPAPDQPLHLPVGGITRAHLARLLAMACIIREPSRFDVQLPQADEVTQLSRVSLPVAADLASAAKLAHLPLAKLRELNPGYRGKRMPTDAPHHLLLPQANADDLLAAVAADGIDALASTTDSPTAKSSHHKSSHHRRIARYKVRQGESLLSIATRYHLDARKLRAWNGLAASDDVHPGMTLRLTAPD
ncbi:MAG TPA: transglycosylase SLT domain-containing protein [Rhodanobacteraceae bacterium]|nr:transglycosylase SLT domain-containing protein [Rhodanobacteraceae bacterium]